MIKPSRFLAPAKINLTLEVLSRRDDGYHGVRSVMVPLEFSDEITVAPSGPTIETSSYARWPRSATCRRTASG